MWTGSGTEEMPVLEKGDEVQLFVPDPAQTIGESSVYCLYINGKKPSGSEISYAIRQVLHDAQSTMFPVHAFTTINRVDELFLTVSFCESKHPEPGSIYALEEKCNRFRANSTYKEVRKLELSYLEDARSWLLHVKPAKLNHRYSIKWKWSEQNSENSNFCIPEL
ncbi:hypothetical protein [Adlercreutzia equolifaciens]|uniref:hypothetical protein n=1 Tax=Adlercreutzia equolifaciens TaxID=446660 RepID=UPI001CC4D20E|nr:hypothetical protein [Adlercreutzia equolifaciens]